MSLLKPRFQFKPFAYPEAFEYYQTISKMHWLGIEVPMSGDTIDWEQNLSDTDKAIIGQILKGFTQAEVIIADYWSNKVCKWFQIPEIQMAARVIAAQEIEHQFSYDYLNTILGIEDYSAFLEDPTVKARLDRMLEVKDSSDRRDIARSLAIFSGYGEGVSLFSQFAILMSYSRRNLLKGVGQITAYSSLDECLVPETEVLTTEGWKSIADITLLDKVAQFNLEDNSISFTNPSRVVESYSEEMISFSSDRGGFNQVVTPNHRMVIQPFRKDKWDFVEARDCSFHCYNRAPLSGNLVENGRRLSTLERFFIVTQADGSISDRYTGAITGFRPINFYFSKERKIKRFEGILDKLKFNFKKIFKNPEGNKKAGVLYRVNVPESIVNSIDLKRFDWVKLDEINSVWAEEFIEEVRHWDGYTNKDYPTSMYYSSKVKDNVVLMQTLSSLCGRNGVISVSKDNRKDTYSDIYRIWITKKSSKNGSAIDKKTIPYSGKVYCLTVQTGAFLVKYKDTISITGNCTHSKFGCWLFREFIKENRDIWDDDLKRDLYEAARLTVKLEDDFIDKIYSLGDVVGVDKDCLKQYIRYRANVKLNELGLKNNWKTLDMDKVKKVSIPFDLMLSDLTNQDFFAQTETQYSKGTNFDKMWEGLDVTGDER